MLMMFYLNVFYLPTLKDVGHYKLQNEVMFWFTETLCYNVYIPLLIRQANDVEENPGPPIFDIIDPTTTVSADFSQGNEALFGVNAGFPASRGLSREGKLKREERDLCRLPMSFLSHMHSHFLNNR